MRRTGLVWCALAVLCTSLVAVSTPSAAAPAIVFTGRIVDQRTGRPIVDVEVSAPEQAFPLPGVVPPSDRTDSSGRFRIVVPDSKARRLFVDERARDYEMGWVGKPAGLQQKRQIVFVREPASHRPGGLGVIRMERKVWSGRLVDARNGRPIQGLEVYFQLADGSTVDGSGIPHFSGVPMPKFSAITDAEGRFRISQNDREDEVDLLWHDRYRVCVITAGDLEVTPQVYEHGCTSSASGTRGLLVSAGATASFRAGQLGTIQVDRSVRSD